MSRVIALVPARAGSKGIPGKNFRMLGDKPLYGHAIEVAARADCYWIVLSTDSDLAGAKAWPCDPMTMFRHLLRPVELAQDDTPMLAVVQHALQQIPGEPDDIWVLLQPTQPLRKPEHLREAVRLLRETGADSVVSVVELPRTHNAEFQLWISSESQRLWTVSGDRFALLPGRRQDCEHDPVYIRDGTCYAFWRKTVDEHGSIYGQDVRPLIIDPADSCELDTEEQWTELERRWNASGRK